MSITELKHKNEKEVAKEFAAEQKAKAKEDKESLQADFHPSADLMLCLFCSDPVVA